jgi:hypothetical protein
VLIAGVKQHVLLIKLSVVQAVKIYKMIDIIAEVVTTLVLLVRVRCLCNVSMEVANQIVRPARPCVLMVAAIFRLTVIAVLAE